MHVDDDYRRFKRGTRLDMCCWDIIGVASGHTGCIQYRRQRAARMGWDVARA